jgi:hypothetical protein
VALAQAAGVRFLRHLAAVMLVVAVVVVLGLAWNRFAAGSLAGGLTAPSGRIAVVPGRQVKGPPPGAVSLPSGAHVSRVIRSGGFNLGLNSMFQSVNLPYLRHTVVIEGGVIAAVVILDVGRRRSRRARRAQRLAPPVSGDGDGAG